MSVREYTFSDLRSIEGLHSNPAYQMPNLEHPLMVIRKVMTDEEDRPRMAAFGRIHINALLFVDHSWKTPAERLEKLKELQLEMMDEARKMKLDIATTQTEGRFAKRLMDELGWIRGFGEIYYHDI